MAELIEKDEIREAVRERYAAAASSVQKGQIACCGPSAAEADEMSAASCGCGADIPDACGGETFGAGLYESRDQDALPDAAKLASLGCGNPTAVAELNEGETVLDLGSGGGIDVLLSARRVGRSGKAYGVDMTDEMLDLARRNQREAGVENVEFLKGTIEDVPLPADSVDVIISNCVINLSGDKPTVFREAARLLRPGGRFAVSDIVADPGMDEATRVDMSQWTGCIAGALTEEEFRSELEATGFEEIEIRESHRVHDQAGSAIIRAKTPGMSSADTLTLKDPEQLYLDWEHTHWASQDVDLSRDPADWAGLEEGERDLLYFVLSSLMVAEERISTQFCGLVLAQDDEEEGSYLSTQLVDEVRHMQFYARFQNEVIADPDTIGVHVARARLVLGDAFERVFDQALVQAHDRLRLDPSDREAKVRFVAIYHMVIEGTLGLTASHFILGYLRERELLPGFTEGYGRIASDEQRHIAYGTWFLREAVAADAAMADVIRAQIGDLLPAVAESISPPSEGAWDVLGVEDGALAEFALGALNRRLALIGAPLA